MIEQRHRADELAAAEPEPLSRTDAVLTAGAAAFSLIGLLAIGIVLGQAAFHARPSALMTFTGMICLPIGFAGLMAVLVRAILRRRRT